MRSVQDNKNEFWFIQFKEKGKTFLWMEYAWGLSTSGYWPWPTGVCRWRVTLKDKRTTTEKLLDFGKRKKYWNKHIYASQIMNEC